MNTKRNKRWNGEMANLSADYLKNVIEKMQTYGEKVQFSTNGTIHGPHYQVITATGKKIAFNGSNLLIHADENEFVGSVSEVVHSLNHIKTLLLKLSSPTAKSTSTVKRATKSSTGTGTSSPRGGTALAKMKEQIAIQKYDYYKLNRATLPSDIREHSEEITRMMENGMSAENAFNEAIKLCFEH